MNDSFYKSIHELDSKNTKFKSLFNLPGFNYDKKPIKVTDNLNINNHFVYNDKVIDEKIFVKFFGIVNDSKNKNFDKKTKKNKEKKNETKKNETKKMKPKITKF